MVCLLIILHHFGLAIVIATMVLISVNVFDVCCKKTLLTWTVLETHDDTLTVSTFYETVSEERYRAGAVPS